MPLGSGGGGGRNNQQQLRRCNPKLTYLIGFFLSAQLLLLFFFSPKAQQHHDTHVAVNHAPTKDKFFDTQKKLTKNQFAVLKKKAAEFENHVPVNNGKDNLDDTSNLAKNNNILEEKKPQQVDNLVPNDRLDDNTKSVDKASDEEVEKPHQVDNPSKNANANSVDNADDDEEDKPQQVDNPAKDKIDDSVDSSDDQEDNKPVENNRGVKKDGVDNSAHDSDDQEDDKSQHVDNQAKDDGLDDDNANSADNSDDQEGKVDTQVNQIFTENSKKSQHNGANHSLVATRKSKDRSSGKKKHDKSGTHTHNNPYYETDLLCGGCRVTVAHKQRTCGDSIAHMMKKKNWTLLAAANHVANERFPQSCGRCNPNNCTQEEKKYWRYDVIAPKVLYAQTHYLKSIPPTHRIPHPVLAANNVTTFFSNRQNVYPRREYFFEYNPSIVKIPENYAQNLGDNDNDNDDERPVYLVSYRVSTQQSCFRTEDSQKMIGGSFDAHRNSEYLALALLRSDLTVLYDMVTLPLQLPKRDDYRLNVIHNTVYISSRSYVTPLWVTTREDDPRINDDDKEILQPQFIPPVITKNFTFIIGKYASEFTRDRQDLKTAKNLNYFVDQENRTLVEIFPGKTHKVNEVFLSDSSKKPGESAILDSYNSKISFYTVDEQHYAKFGIFTSALTDDRGSSCCIPIPDPRYSASTARASLLLGVSHVKTPHGRKGFEGIVPSNLYFTKFYAFEPTSPYRIIARSGAFCFGFPDEDESLSNPLVKVNLHDQLVLDKPYHCPRIHFVAGMTEKVGDESKLIIAFGVNDCFSRMVEVEKSEVLDLLFSHSLKLVDSQ